MSRDIQYIKEKAVPIMKESGVLRSSLFGSVVRGENKNKSDIDFLIELPESKNLFDVIKLKYRLEDALKRKVDLVEYETVKPGLKEYIHNEQIDIL